MIRKMTRKLPIGMHIHLYCETGTVCREYLTLKTCTCSKKATGLASRATGLGAASAAGLLHSWLRVWHEVWQLWE